MEQLLQDLKQQNFKNVYLLCGDETYLRNQYKKKLRDALVMDGDTMNYSYYEGKDINPRAVIDMAETLPFFADRRVLMVENSGFFKNKCEELADYVAVIPESTCFIFVETELDKRNRLYKEVKKHGRVVEFGTQKDDVLIKWILGMLKKEGKNITKDTLQAFLAKTGSDMQLIKNELDKLVAYTEGRDVITTADVEHVCITQTTNKIFDMINNMRQYDDTTYAHSINVALISNVLAGWIGLEEQEVLLATQCGLLHDIGKLTIPSNIIKKPGELTAEEFNIMKTHAYAGYELLSKHNVNPHILNAAMMHHERFDGSGYPFGLRGEKIDVYARIVSIADVYDAMTSRRIYRTAICPFKVIETFEKEGLQKYDAQFILTFMENVLDTYIRSRVRLSDGRNGEVIMINKQKMSRPLIRSGSCYIDLSKEPDAVYVEEIL